MEQGPLQRQWQRNLRTGIVHRGEPHGFGPSTFYDLLEGGRRYPPKAVVGLAARRTLVDEAESLRESTAWKATTERYAAIVEEWKSLPRGDRTSEQELWQRLSHARTAFDKRRRTHFSELDTQRKDAVGRKRDLIARAEALSTSTDWAKTGKQYRDLMGDWKAAPRASRADEDKLWKRFKAAQDAFFAARIAAEDAEQEAERKRLWYVAATRAKDRLVLSGFHSGKYDKGCAAVALLADLEQSGELDETLIVVMSEMGRTPKINASAGRDHWPQCSPALLAGAGVKRGHVHGRSDKLGAYPASDPCRPEDLSATLFHLLGIDPATEIRDALNRPLPLSPGRVIEGVLA